MRPSSGVLGIVRVEVEAAMRCKGRCLNAEAAGRRLRVSERAMANAVKSRRLRESCRMRKGGEWREEPEVEVSGTRERSKSS